MSVYGPCGNNKATRGFFKSISRITSQNADCKVQFIAAAHLAKRILRLLSYKNSSIRLSIWLFQTQWFIVKTERYNKTRKKEYQNEQETHQEMR